MLTALRLANFSSHLLPQPQWFDHDQGRHKGVTTEPDVAVARLDAEMTGTKTVDEIATPDLDTKTVAAEDSNGKRSARTITAKNNPSALNVATESARNHHVEKSKLLAQHLSRINLELQTSLE